METGGFLTGIPLGAVKTARFLNKAGTFFTLAKLIYNGNTYRFSSAQDGAVTANADFLSWKFIGPDGRFDLDTLAAGTAAEMLEAMADTCQESPVPAWEENGYTEFYKEMIRLRHENPALAAGEKGGKFEIVSTADSTIVYTRTLPENKVTVSVQLRAPWKWDVNVE